MNLKLLILVSLVTCHLQAKTMEQIIANPEPGEYLLDKEVVLKRDKDERQYRNEKGNWQSIKVNLLRVHANKQITLEYYHKELPKFEIQPFLVKHRPIIDICIFFHRSTQGVHLLQRQIW